MEKYNYLNTGRRVFAQESSLELLSSLLCRYHGQKVILLIDEYDVPLDKAFQHGYYEEMVSLIRGLSGQALKTNEFLQFAVLTGCLRVSKVSARLFPQEMYRPSRICCMTICGIQSV